MTGKELYDEYISGLLADPFEELDEEGQAGWNFLAEKVEWKNDTRITKNT